MKDIWDCGPYGKMLGLTYLLQLLTYFNICYDVFALSSNKFATKILDLGATLLLRKKINFEAFFLVPLVPITRLYSGEGSQWGCSFDG